jgi:hypothetical protein
MARNRVELGNHVRFAVNTKGTGQRKVPTAIAELSRTEMALAVEDPTTLTTVGNAVRGLRDLGKQRKVRLNHSTTRMKSRVS